MKAVFHIFKNDIRAIVKYIFVIVIVLAIGTLPSLYAWINIYAGWDPYAGTDQIEVALSSRDALDAVRECIGGMYGHTYIKCLGILLLFGLGMVAFGLLLHKPMKGIIEKVEESKRESDVML